MSTTSFICGSPHGYNVARALTYLDPMRLRSGREVHYEGKVPPYVDDHEYNGKDDYDLPQDFVDPDFSGDETEDYNDNDNEFWDEVPPLEFVPSTAIPIPTPPTLFANTPLRHPQPRRVYPPVSHSPTPDDIKRDRDYNPSPPPTQPITPPAESMEPETQETTPIEPDDDEEEADRQAQREVEYLNHQDDHLAYLSTLPEAHQ